MRVTTLTTFLIARISKRTKFSTKILSGSENEALGACAIELHFRNFEILFKSVNYCQLSLKAGYHSHNYPDSTSYKMRATTLTTALIARISKKTKFSTKILSGSENEALGACAIELHFRNFEILFKSVNYRQLSLRAGLHSHSFPKSELPLAQFS